ncbi:DNA-directed RNA polymerase subunit alpha [Mycoplasma sp. Mirounga ES2805-ORL]|uniref:DNA-directed RNA polymerase subunit alpha n=1 Tax=Mycoplasma sp. Mirounga ES2805-ORL TaxID=754514 RepID=UPI00197B6A08|nr:DNA-directed RNA polymerase subunit alpha [Mycoplasma sp. Mirounga ES2805-ORL]QSF13896.1 DNA-directed RNA polymerase subunit alpha [Mycoplasma sp. Mirounga ES2805-ORL]
MKKMTKLEYIQIPKNANSVENETVFSVKPLERGFGKTVGVALRRVLLSNITSLGLFAVKIEGVDHEFQTIPGVLEDVTALIMNLRKVKFQYDPNLVGDDDIIKVTLKASNPGSVTSGNLEVANSSIEVINKNQEICNLSSKGSINLEMYLRSGRGFVSNEENKKFISNPSLFSGKIESKIKKGIFIATDSNFSPIEKVNYTVSELNTSSNQIEEELLFTIITDGTIDSKIAIQQACEILVSHFKLIGDVDEMKLEVFETAIEEELEKEDTDIDINSLNLSVRSLNALRNIGKTKLSQIASMTYEQLEQTKNLGAKSLEEIISKLKEYGYELSKGGDE